MQIDLGAAARQTSNGTTGKVRAEWSGGAIKIDESKFLDLVARAIAMTMGNHLFEGRRPDGSGPMPARQYDGQPRGQGARIARALAPVQTGPLTWIIAAHREQIGHMQRLMKDVPFRAPPIEAIRTAVHRAFEAAVTLQASQASVKQMRLGGATRTQLRAPRALVKQNRQALITSLRDDLGIGGKNLLRSAMSRRVRRAARVQLRELNAFRVTNTIGGFGK